MKMHCPRSAAKVDPFVLFVQQVWDKAREGDAEAMSIVVNKLLLQPGTTFPITLPRGALK